MTEADSKNKNSTASEGNDKLELPILSPNSEEEKISSKDKKFTWWETNNPGADHIMFTKVFSQVLYLLVPAVSAKWFENCTVLCTPTDGTSRRSRTLLCFLCLFSRLCHSADDRSFWPEVCTKQLAFPWADGAALECHKSWAASRRLGIYRQLNLLN